MAVDREDKRFFDFMCSCGEENAKRCEDIYDEVVELLGDHVTDKSFATHIVYGLGWDLENGEAEIVGIPNDMWSAISVEYYHGKEVQSFWIECDNIHHGLARAYQLVTEFDKTLNK